MEPDTFFDEAGLSALRDEVEREGVLVDSLLTQAPDSAVYGVNLACAYPFPNDRRGFLAAFDAISARTTLGQVRVSEVLLTAETRPYMRGGGVRLRFPLSS